MEYDAHSRLALGKANKAIEAVDRKSISHTGLNITDSLILEALLQKGPLPINKTGKKILLTRGSTTAAVDRLAERKLIERVQDPLDRRRFFLNLTKTGPQLMRSEYRIHRKNLVKRSMTTAGG